MKLRCPACGVALLPLLLGNSTHFILGEGTKLSVHLLLRGCSSMDIFLNKHAFTLPQKKKKIELDTLLLDYLNLSLVCFSMSNTLVLAIQCVVCIAAAWTSSWSLLKCCWSSLCIVAKSSVIHTPTVRGETSFFAHFSRALTGTERKIPVDLASAWLSYFFTYYSLNIKKEQEAKRMVVGIQRRNEKRLEELRGLTVDTLDTLAPSLKDFRLGNLCYWQFLAWAKLKGMRNLSHSCCCLSLWRALKQGFHCTVVISLA